MCFELSYRWNRGWTNLLFQNDSSFSACVAFVEAGDESTGWSSGFELEVSAKLWKLSYEQGVWWRQCYWHSLILSNSQHVFALTNFFSHNHWYTYLKTRCKVTFFSLQWTPPFNYRRIIKSGFLRNIVVFFRGNTVYLDTFWRDDVSIWCVPSSHARWWALESWSIIFKILVVFIFSSSDVSIYVSSIFSL